MVRLLLTIILSLSSILMLNAQKWQFEKTAMNQPNRVSSFCLSNTKQNHTYLFENNIPIKYSTENWLFISCPPSWIKDYVSNNIKDNFFYENYPPALLGDTAVGTHFADSVHLGTGGLESSYTGKGVIIGVVDTGIDYQHNDFKDENGNTRVLRFWDQTMPDIDSPLPYGYGFVWDSSAINSGACTSVDEYPHGTMVAGQAAGNGRSNGSNIGIAPEADIVIVKTDFTRPNWSLTVADACDYIFTVADSLGLPAVVNLSLGSYLGSHDGNDPAAEAIESMLDEKPGRIVVSANGNSGDFDSYHVHNDITADTSFVLLIPNPDSDYGPNTIYFDLWSETVDATWNYSIAVDRPATDWSEAGTTIFRGAMDNIGTTFSDTIRNQNNDILGVAWIETETIGDAYHMEVLIADADSLPLPPYLYRFNTVGSGNYDLWSGRNNDRNQIIGDTTGAHTYPNIERIILPDLEQCITSSWNSSEKVVSVGNIKARSSYVDNNGNNYVSDPSPVGSLSAKSSKGPNRHGYTKPDIVATGNITLAPAPLWLLSNPAYNAYIDSGGHHMAYGGSSMSSPVVAGIAALYLERCKFATYQDFIDDLHNTAFTDAFTGTVPNNSFGYGKAHALHTLLQKSLPTTPIITPDFGVPSLSSSPGSTYSWYVNDTIINNENDQEIIISPPYGSYQVEISNTEGCTALSEPFNLTAGLNEKHQHVLHIYPNPSSKVIQFNDSTIIQTVHAVDSNGKVVQLDQETNGQYIIEHLPVGQYQLLIQTNSGNYSSKFVRN